MKITRLMLLAPLGPLLAAFAGAAPIATTSTVSAVTVYADRAVVTRHTHIELPAGPSELTFEKLPESLVDASLQVAGTGTANASILDVAAHLTYVDTSADPKEKILEDALTELRKDDRALADRSTALAHEFALLGQIENVALAPAADGKTSRLAFADWEGLIAFSDKNAGRLAESQRQLDKEITAKAAQIAVKEAELRDLRGNRVARKSYKTVTVRLNAAKAGALDLALTGALPNASWTPVYDARLHTDTHLVDLAYFGLVRNATGEDWNDVALTLSTARPALGGSSVEPSPWILDVLRPVVVPAPRQARGGRGGSAGPGGGGGGFGGGAGGGQGRGQGQLSQQLALSNNSAIISRPEIVTTSNQPAMIFVGGQNAQDLSTALGDAETAGWSNAAVDLGATSATFKVADPVTLQGDNTPRRVAIITKPLPAQLQYQSVPRNAETAFLSAYITNKTDYPLLTGALNVFLDDNFVAASRLASTTMPDERFQLALGADEGIAIKRTVIPPFKEEAGFTGKTRRVTYETQYTVTNNKKSPQRVMFKDVLPVSRDEKIQVTLVEPAARDVLKPEDIIVPGQLPKPGITKEEDGRIVWRADIGPGKANEKKFTFKFTVEYPNDVTVSGLQ